MGNVPSFTMHLADTSRTRSDIFVGKQEGGASIVSHWHTVQIRIFSGWYHPPLKKVLPYNLYIRTH